MRSWSISEVTIFLNIASRWDDVRFNFRNLIPFFILIQMMPWRQTSNGARSFSIPDGVQVLSHGLNLFR